MAEPSESDLDVVCVEGGLFTVKNVTIGELAQQVADRALEIVNERLAADRAADDA